VSGTHGIGGPGSEYTRTADAGVIGYHHDHEPSEL
jgi:hypothetical protein